MGRKTRNSTPQILEPRARARARPADNFTSSRIISGVESRPYVQTTPGKHVQTTRPGASSSEVDLVVCCSNGLSSVRLKRLANRQAQRRAPLRLSWKNDYTLNETASQELLRVLFHCCENEVLC